MTAVDGAIRLMQRRRSNVTCLLHIITLRPTGPLTPPCHCSKKTQSNNKLPTEANKQTDKPSDRLANQPTDQVQFSAVQLVKGLPIFSFISFCLFFFLLSFYLFLLLFLFFPTSCLLVSEVTPSARDHRPCTAQTAKPPQTTTLRPHPSAVSAVAQHPAAGRAAWRPELCQGSGWKGVSANAPGRRAGYGRSVRQPLPSGGWRAEVGDVVWASAACPVLDGRWIGDAAVAQHGVGGCSQMGSAGGWCWPVVGDGETGIGDGRVDASVVYPSVLSARSREGVVDLCHRHRDGGWASRSAPLRGRILWPAHG